MEIPVATIAGQKRTYVDVTQQQQQQIEESKDGAAPPKKEDLKLRGLQDII